MNLFFQIWVSVFGVSALWLTFSPRPSTRRWAVVLGLLGQPGWYFQLIHHDQWGMLPAYLGYTFAWVRGLWLHWIRPSVEDLEKALAAHLEPETPHDRPH